MKIYAATYSRFSSENQRMSSITDQQRNMHKRASAEGWHVVRDYADAAISGTSSRRPQYLEMVSAAERGEFQVLLIDDLSRLTRDALEQERVMRKLEFANIRIISLADGYDSTSKARKVHRGVKGLLNEIFLDDLAAKVHRGQAGQALKGRWNGGKPFGYRLKKILDETRRDQYGEPTRVGTELIIDPVQAKIVEEIFTRFVEGESCGAIARDLNARAVPSAGSTWNRKVRRCEKWVESAVRVIVSNPLYTGRVRWNRRQFVRNPESGSYVARQRPESEHIVVANEALRVVTDDIFNGARSRLDRGKNDDPRLKHGGKKKFVLSGLMRCASCGRSYVCADGRSYACGSFLAGGEHACPNRLRVRRDVLEKALLAPICDQLLDPLTVQKRAKEMQAAIIRRSARTESPRELQELESRIARLRSRLRDGDPDLTADELQVAIASAEAKRAKLAAAPNVQSTTVHPMLPRVAERYRQEILGGLAGGSERDAARAREIVRAILGTISMRTDDQGVWAECSISMEPMLLAAASGGGGAALSFGRGERI
jgi:site-specific DNA recombinase